jgi:large subunit ribosomal protein L13
MTTVFAKPGAVRGDWFVVDASGKTLGRLASQIAHRLKGKHKPDYSPHVDMGDHIVIALGKLLDEHPERVIQFAVKGMLPKNTLGRSMFRKLHVFAGAEHPHAAQQPRPLEIKGA